MGEYAIRKSDRQTVKIGTCENMYYIRFEDRHNVTEAPGNLNCADCEGLYWRIPFPDEDNILIGDYPDSFRSVELWNYSFPEAIEHTGTMQMRDEKSGLLLNIKCYHNMQLPTGSDDIKPFWNGKTSHVFALTAIKNTADGIKFAIQCKFCRAQWLCDWEDIKQYVTNQELHDRLEAYTQQKEA